MLVITKTSHAKLKRRTYALYLPESLPSTALLETPPQPVEDWEVGFRYARFTRLSADRALGSDRTLMEGMLLNSA